MIIFVVVRTVQLDYAIFIFIFIKPDEKFDVQKKRNSPKIHSNINVNKNNYDNDDDNDNDKDNK